MWPTVVVLPDCYPLSRDLVLRVAVRRRVAVSSASAIRKCYDNHLGLRFLQRMMMTESPFMDVVWSYFHDLKCECFLNTTTLTVVSFRFPIQFNSMQVAVHLPRPSACGARLLCSCSWWAVCLSPQGASALAAGTTATTTTFSSSTATPTATLQEATETLPANESLVKLQLKLVQTKLSKSFHRFQDMGPCKLYIQLWTTCRNLLGA